MAHPSRILEIINRQPVNQSIEYSESEMLEVITYYIGVRKNRHISIQPPSIGGVSFMMNFGLMSHAFDTAREWLLNNK